VFPDFELLQLMRKAQGPFILEQPTKVFGDQLILNYKLTQPFVVAIRICSRNIPAPKKVSNLRVIKLNFEEIIIFWSDKFYKSRCIKTYEIFFRYNNGEFHKVETSHISNMFCQLKHSIPGCFKIRSVDITGRASKFSDEICYE
jgi:L-iduronidase